MSFLEKIAGIRMTLGLSEELVAAPAVVLAALPMMGVVPEPSCTLPQCVDALVAALGLTFGETSAAAAAAAAAPSTPTAATPTAANQSSSSKSADKMPASSSRQRPADDFPPASSASKQSKMFHSKDIAKFFVPKKQADAAAKRQGVGEAVSAEEFEAVVALEVVELPSERAPPRVQVAAVYGCSRCNFTARTPSALKSHEIWKHPSQPRKPVDMPARPFHGRVNASVSLVEGSVRLMVRINGKGREQLLREAEEGRLAAAAA
jgi:hypothetical protein